MPAWIAGGIAASGLLGDMFSSSGQQATNAQNMQIAQMNNQFNAQQAQLNRNFQEQMSDTAMTRRVQDLKNANLNPLLAIGAGGASSPAGSSAQSAGLPTINNPAASFANAGQIASQAAGTAVDANLKDAQANLYDKQAQKLGAEIPYSGLNAQAQNTSLNQQISNLQQEFKNMLASYNVTSANARSAATDADFRYDYDRLTNQGVQLSNTAKRLGNVEAQAEANFYAGPKAPAVVEAQQVAKAGGSTAGLASLATSAAGSQQAQSILQPARDWTTDMMENVANHVSDLIQRFSDWRYHGQGRR